MISFLQSKNLSSFQNLEHGFLKKDQTLSPPPYLLKQVHSNRVLTIEEPLSQILEADGMVTRLAHFALGIKSADCVPILLFDPEASVIGALHAGWRGALHGICHNGVLAMESLGAKRSRILAALGPSISQENYEVGPEVYDLFLKQDVENKKFFRPSSQEHYSLFDLKNYVAHYLHHEGLTHIEILPFNTYTSTHLFHSYRRLTHTSSTPILTNPFSNLSFIKII